MGENNKKIRILSVFGTRPEAIKMAPVVLALRENAEVESAVCVTAQHRELLDQVTEFFQIDTDFDLDIMRPNQSPMDITAAVMQTLPAVLTEYRPDCVLVHGDTTTTCAASLAAYYAGIPVGHVEAGLRTGDFSAPWPEEMNRVVTGRLATFHFAPTPIAQENLLGEGVNADHIWVTGNTVIDAVRMAAAKLGDPAKANADKKLILVTAHRRENFGQRMQDIAAAIASLAKREDVEIVISVHPNPNAKGVIEATLAGLPRVRLIDPPSYPDFILLLKQAELILSDSGGIQEEAAALGKHVLLMRDKTERPEGIDAGVVTLVGADQALIVAEAFKQLDETPNQATKGAKDIYGDGTAAEQIVTALRARLPVAP